MFIQVKHVTRYSYSQPVFCDPLSVRLRPREDPTQRLHKFRLEIWPEPAGMSEHIDLAGNPVAVAWFQDLSLSLSITSTFLVETSRGNPYNFVLDPEAVHLPLRRPIDDHGLFAYYLRDDEVSPHVLRYAEDLAAEVKFETVPFLSALAARLFDRTTRVIRPLGEAWPAELTLTEATGSCRDLAVLFNACARAMGLPARFVSGYAPAASAVEELHLHAWSEVYLPGAGWRAFDPSRGLAVGDDHVPVAAGRSPREAAPTHGTFRSAGARSQMQTQIAMNQSQDDPRKRMSAA